MKSLAIGLAAVLLTGCASHSMNNPAIFGRAELRNAQGVSIGSARLVPLDQGKLGLQINLAGLPAGRVHGAHLHMVGRCDGPDFTSAGSHLNPNGRQHGADNAAGSHLGDLPNIVISPDGTASVSVTIPGQSAAVLPSIFDADGSALVIHASADDYRTDPTGNSGARIACGAFSMDNA